MRRFTRLWRNLRHRGALERDLADELHATHEMLVAEKIRAGLTADEAQRAARLELGSVESLKDSVRDVRPGARLDVLWQDLRYAARLLSRNPLFALTAVLSLAVGIGATTAAFTIANGLLLRSVPGVAEPDRLVDIVRLEVNDPGVHPISYLHYRDVRARATLLDDVYAYQLNLEAVSLRESDTAERAFATFVTANYFDVLGVPAAAGRMFGAAGRNSEEAGAVAVLNHGFWMRRFAGNRDIVGRTVAINRQPVVVIGVAAETFRGTTILSPDLWIPAEMAAVLQPETASARFETRDNGWLMLGGRLEPGVTRAQAAAEIQLLGAALEREFPPPPSYTPAGMQTAAYAWGAEPTSLVPAGLRLFAGSIAALFTVLVSLVLAIACMNLAGILLSRATARRREIAVRAAIGAGRVRIIRQLLTETVLLFAIGGATGLVAARGMTTGFVAMLPAFPFPVAIEVPVDVTVVVFSMVLAMAAALLCGLAPALHASRGDLVLALKDESQGPSQSTRLRNAFIVGQVAFSVLLVVTAGMFARGLNEISAQDPGFATSGLDVVAVDLAMAGYTDATGPRAARELVDRIRLVPGVQRASIADRVPGAGGRSFGAVTVPGVEPPNGLPFFYPNWLLVGPGYFSTLGVRLQAGREFDDTDREGSEPVAIVSEGAARRYWPGQNPLDQFLLIHRGNPLSPDAPAPARVRVIGVASDPLPTGGGRRTPIELYVPFDQRYVSTITIVARRSSASVAGELRAAVTDADANLPVLEAQALDTYQDNAIETQLRIAAGLAGTVGLIGLMLAAIGVYGVTAYTVTRRTREIGIRLSLGANRVDIARLVLKQTAVLVVTGSAAGVAMAIAAGALMSSLPWGVGAPDLTLLAGAIGLFAAVALGACFVPLRRATAIRAMDALRYE